MLRFLADESAGGLAEQIDRYLDAFESDRVRLAPAIESAPPREIHRVAHRLASHASLINATELKQLCVELQARASEERIVLAGLAAEFDRGFADLRCRLEAFRASLGSA
jgi:HPt (histidine-containing phosphotransfer) domain-containing protein